MTRTPSRCVWPPSSDPSQLQPPPSPAQLIHLFRLSWPHTSPRWQVHRAPGSRASTAAAAPSQEPRAMPAINDQAICHHPQAKHPSTAARAARAGAVPALSPASCALRFSPYGSGGRAAAPVWPLAKTRTCGCAADAGEGVRAAEWDGGCGCLDGWIHGASRARFRSNVLAFAASPRPLASLLSCLRVGHTHVKSRFGGRLWVTPLGCMRARRRGRERLRGVSTAYVGTDMTASRSCGRRRRSRSRR